MIFRVILAFLAAVVVAGVLAATASTQFVLAELKGLGVDIPLGARFSMTAHDIVGMGTLYFPIIGVAFLIAFPVAALIVRFLLPGWTTVGYTLAGFVAILSLLLIMIAVFGLIPVAGARSTAGLLAQCLAGGAGGYFFARLLQGAREPARP